jgi:branched-subunit amino acid transport protein
VNRLTDGTYVIVACVGMAATTIATRGSFFVLPARIPLSARLERALRYAPACALMAIVAPGVLTKSGHAVLTLNNPRLWAVMIAAGVFVKTRNMLAMMGLGMVAFTVLRLIL